LTERDWQRLENTMTFIVEQQAKFEANIATHDKRFAAAERRMDRLERFADRTIKAAERRWAKVDERLDAAEADRAELRAMFKSFLQSMRRSQGNGKNKP
jgi:septal ring factor EnvC (AmiA/AmiB activator)